MAELLGAGMEEPVNRNGAFPRLTEDQRARLRMLGTIERVAPGDILIRQGDDSYDFFLIEEGFVAIVDGYEELNRVIAVHGPGRFVGELGLLTDGRAFLTAIVRDAGEVTRIPGAILRSLIAQDEELSNIIVRAFLERRSILIGLETGHRVIGSRFSPDSRRLREFLVRNRVPYQWVDLEDDAEAEQLLRSGGVDAGDTPVVMVAGGETLRNPSNAELARAIGLGARGDTPSMCDLVVIGGGPAGLAAALYGASEGLDTQAIESVAFGGQASTSARIENYLGFPAGISGSELAERAQLQADKFGARLVVPAEAVGVHTEDGHYAIALSSGDVVRGRTVVVATGAHYRKLDLPELDRFEMTSVFYAATQAEGQLCFGEPVVIVGGGNSAGQAAMFLSQHAASCTLLIRGGDLGKSMSRYLVDEIENRSQVNVQPYSQVVELIGESELDAVVVEDPRTGERRHLAAKALFVFIGASPHTNWIRDFVAADSAGFLLTGRDVVDVDAFDGDRPLFLETSRPGIFAVGDVHSGSIKRVASAVGEGSMAVRLVHQRLAS